MLIIFILLLVAILFAWLGHRRQTLFFFAITVGLSIIMFLRHIDTYLTIQL